MFFWTPTEAQGPGDYTFKVEVWDDGSPSRFNSETITVTVNEVNVVPMLGSIGNRTVDEETMLSFTAMVSDPDLPANTLTFCLVDAPDGVSIDPSTGVCTWTPTESQGPADYTFTVQVSDGSLSDAETITVTVNEVNVAPVATNLSANGDEDTAINGTVSATDVDANALTYARVANPAHGNVVVSPNGSFTYMPNADYHGSDCFTFKANDGSLDSNLATVTITVNSISDAPVAANLSFSGNEDTAINGSVVATDGDGDALAYTVVDGPANGSLNLNLDGSFTYTPDANYHGPDDFTFKANDGSTDSNVATVSITVNSVNDAPVAAGGTAIGDEDTAINGTVSATDVEGDVLTYALVGSSVHGGVVVSPNGTFSYLPNLNYRGLDSFTFKANDGIADSNLATVVITVNSVNDAPVAANVSVTGDKNREITGAAIATDADGDTLSYSLVTSPAIGSLILNADGTFIYTPSANLPRARQLHLQGQRRERGFQRGHGDDLRGSGRDQLDPPVRHQSAGDRIWTGN